MEQKNIELALRKQKDNAGMLFTKLHYKEINKGILAASIRLDFTEISINLNPKRGWNDVFETAKTLTEHEIGHWKHCPYDLSYHLEIVSNIIDVVKQKFPEMNFSEKPLENGFVCDISNIYEDVIDNLFIDEQNFSEIYAKTSVTEKSKISKGFQFALSVQLQLWGTEEDYKLLMPIIEKEPYNSATDYLKEIGINKNDTLIRKRRILGYKNDWGDYARTFTKYYLKYYDPNENKNQPQKQNGQEEQNKQSDNQNGQGKKDQKNQEGEGQGKGQGKEEEGKQEGKGQGSGQGQGKEEEGQDKDNGKGQKNNENDNDEEPTIIIDNNPFEEDVKDINKVKRALGKIANRKGMGPAQKVAKNIIKDEITSMDILLDSISPEIEIRHKNENDGYGFPVVPLTKKFLEEDDIDSTILGVGIDEFGEPNLEVGKMHFPINIHGAEIAKQIPDFLYIVDDSGSMGRLNVGDEYFMAMMGLYGTKNWLAKNGHIDYVKFGLIQFSSTTRAWGFDNFEYAHEMKKMILNPQGGGTELNMEVVKRIINNHNKKLIVIMLSDGSIYNWNHIDKEFKNIMGMYQFTFLGIGGLGNAGEDLQKNGFNVINVTDASKLHEIVIDVAASSYGDF